MNEMYKYLEEHNYISKNENKDPLRQQELSTERAECIANKYDNLINELQQENKKQKEVIDKIKEICASVPEDWTICGVEKVYEIEEALKEVSE